MSTYHYNILKSKYGIVFNWTVLVNFKLIYIYIAYLGERQIDILIF